MCRILSGGVGAIVVHVDSIIGMCTTCSRILSGDVGDVGVMVVIIIAAHGSKNRLVYAMIRNNPSSLEGDADRVGPEHSR